jgi:hypothetical protein
MPATPAAIPAEFVSGIQARKISGLTWYMLHKHVIIGKLAVVAEPGSTLRYNRADLERIASERAGGVPCA